MIYCLLCGQKNTFKSAICDYCIQLLPINSTACYRCAIPLDTGESPSSDTICDNCFREPPPFLSSQAPFQYLFPVNQLISKMKYHNRPQYAKLLTTLMINQWHACPGGPTQLPEILIPVPMYPHKQRQRGFNQAVYLAQHLGRQLGIPVLKNALQKTRATEAQNPLFAEQRRQNLRGAFRINPRYRRRLAPVQRIGLVDDVITTGATATEISQVLRSAGIPEIHLLAIARTP